MGFIMQLFFLAVEGLGIASVRKENHPYKKILWILLYLLAGLLLITLFFMVFGAP